MRNFLAKIQRNSHRRSPARSGISGARKTILAVVLFCCIFGFAIAGPVNAADPFGFAIASVVGGLAMLFSGFFGLLLTVFIKILINVAQYNDFINAEVVVAGWVVVRDLCNMFFVLVVLIIAFATILKIESYHVKKLLPKLLLMAILINFSKTICGLIIDFSQVIMLTFVSAFAEYGAGNFINLFNVQNFQSISAVWTGEVSAWNISIAFIAGLIALIITNVVVLVMLAVLVMRIIMLWIYVILSPLAFLLSAFPAGAKYAQQWWGDFSKNVIVGPVLAFFLWLALTTVQESAKAVNVEADNINEICVGPVSIFCEGNFQVYIVTIGFLVGGLIITQQLGGMAGAAAGRGMAAMRRMPKLAGKGALGLAGWGARKFAGAEVKLGKRKFSGFEIRPTKIIAGFKEGLEEKKRKEEMAIQSKAAAELREGKLRGVLGASKDFAEASAHGVFWRRAWQPGKGKDLGKIWQTKRVGSLNKDIKEWKKGQEGLKEDSSEYNKYQNQINEAEKKLETVRAPYTFHAEQSRNALVREAVGKIGDNDNEDDLKAMFDDAINREDKEMAAAVMITAAKVGHLNEIIQSQQATEDVKDETGKVVIKKGDDLDASGYGLNALVNQKLIGELGMSEQEAYSHQSQASTLAKSIGHFDFAESIGVKNGLMFQRNVRGAGGQQERSRGELRKVDAETAIRKYNRLAWMDEVQHYDEKTGKVVRTNKLNDLGKANFAEWADQISKEVDIKRFNKNAAMNIYKSAYNKDGSMNKDGIYGFVEELKAQEVTEYYDFNEKVFKSYEEVADKMVGYGKMITEGEEAVKELAGVAMSKKDVAGEDETKRDTSFRAKAEARVLAKMKADEEEKKGKKGKGKKGKEKKEKKGKKDKTERFED